MFVTAAVSRELGVAPGQPARHCGLANCESWALHLNKELMSVTPVVHDLASSASSEVPTRLPQTIAVALHVRDAIDHTAISDAGIGAENRDSVGRHPKSNAAVREGRLRLRPLDGVSIELTAGGTDVGHIPRG